MNQSIFIVFALVLLTISCQTKDEQINDCLTPFVSSNYSDAKFELNVNNNNYRLVVQTNEIDSSIVDKLLTQTITKLYNCFYNSSNSAAFNSSFEVVIKTPNQKWESETFTLIEMSEMVHLK
jgi:hypothetical protein